jgi:hypothetical protein
VAGTGLPSIRQLATVSADTNAGAIVSSISVGRPRVKPRRPVSSFRAKVA